MHVKTKSGFECEFEPKKVNDMRVIDALASLDKGNPLALSILCDLVFDEQAKENLYKHCENEEHQVPIDVITKEIVEIFSYHEQTKNL